MPILLTPTPGDAEHLIFDPVTEDATNDELDVMTDPYAVTAMSFPAPPLEMSTVGSIDTEGDRIAARRHQNRQVSVTVEVVGDNQTELDVRVAVLEAKVAKLAREGGTLQRVRADGSSRTLDVLAADSYEMQFDITYFVGNVAQVQVGLIAKPYARGSGVTLISHSETTLPVLTFTETSIPGEVPATGRLLINELAGQNQAVVMWGIQSHYYDAAATAALFYQSEGCALGPGGTVATGPAGASSSSVVANTSLTTVGATMHYVGTTTAGQTHIGMFRVLARVYAPSANAGTTSVGLAWKAGTGPLVFNQTVPVTLEDDWVLVDLGLVSIPKAKYGTQAWSGLVNASSTVAGDDVYSDCVALIPVSEGAGQAYSIANPVIAAGGSFQVASDSALSQRSGVYGVPDVYEGDYLQVPMSGAEGRTVRVIVLIGRGPVVSPLLSAPPIYAQDTIDDVSAQLIVTDRYLTVF